MTGGLFGLGAAGIMAFSDCRLKENIKRVGRLANGLAVYAYNYIWDLVPRLGVMADEVRKVMPHAVRVHPSGYDMVDYSEVI
jgi:crotonobetainyl-CoA:carnitine CoA-transferase CaiB-like acyl-CoA transferase